MTQFSNTSYIKYLQKIGISSFLQDYPNNLYDNYLDKKKKSISISIEDIKNLDDLFQYENKIRISKNLDNIKIKYEGNNKNIMLINGYSEDKKIKGIDTPFSEGATLLKKMLKAINLDTEDIYITNIIPWALNEKLNSSNADILECLPIIQKRIEIIKPKIIILMGEIASKAILNSNINFSKLRGKWFKYRSLNLDNSIECLATYHPDFLIKSPSYKKNSWLDLKMIQEKIKDENI